MKEFKLTDWQKKRVLENVLELKAKGEITKEGIIITCNQAEVNFILFGNISPEEYEKEELENMRNVYVAGISEIIEKTLQFGSYEKVERLNDIMQVVTWTIDKYYMKGVETYDRSN